MQAEAKRFLGALARRAQVEGRALFSVAELYEVADALELQVPNTADLITELNDMGRAACTHDRKLCCHAMHACLAADA